MADEPVIREPCKSAREANFSSRLHAFLAKRMMPLNLGEGLLDAALIRHCLGVWLSGEIRSLPWVVLYPDDST